LQLFLGNAGNINKHYLPADIATGDGRIEADQIDITTKDASRVKHILVQKCDLTTPEQVLRAS
jgi:HlyD family secretion protein